MLSLIVFLLAVYGFANAIAVLKFGLPIRLAFTKIAFLRALVSCPPCLSFWAGMAISLLVMSPAMAICDPPRAELKAALLDGLAASAFSYLTHVLMERAGKDLDL